MAVDEGIKDVDVQEEEGVGVEGDEHGEDAAVGSLAETCTRGCGLQAELSSE
jgi:hypothetical protein